MRTAVATHELLPKGLDLESLGIEAGRVSISVSSGARRCPCPLCGRASSRIHSRYSRRVLDLPWHGICVELGVRARRFFCDEGSCGRKIFCERLPAVAARGSPADLAKSGKCLGATYWGAREVPRVSCIGRYPPVGSRLDGETMRERTAVGEGLAHDSRRSRG